MKILPIRRKYTAWSTKTSRILINTGFVLDIFASKKTRGGRIFIRSCVVARKILPNDVGFCTAYLPNPSGTNPTTEERASTTRGRPAGV